MKPAKETRKPQSYRCPTCGKGVERASDFFPFCSERCRDVDLGNWLLERYRIPVVNEAPEEDFGEGAEEDPS